MTPNFSIWGGRALRFLLTVLLLCGLGAGLGAGVFPLVGKLWGVHMTTGRLVVLGARTGGFFFLVWAPGVALVREFMRAAAESPKPRREDA